jgi:hypothetical protein
MTDEERAEFLNKIDPIKAWEMGEGKAESKTEVSGTLEHKVNVDEINKALDDILGEN